METVVAWPSYQTGPHDSIFALGVVSVNYANFERAATWIFAAVCCVPEEYARIDPRSGRNHRVHDTYRTDARQTRLDIRS